MLIDSHCHLDPAYCPDGPDALLERARTVGVGAFICIGVGEDGAAARAAVALSERRSDVFAAVGMHPHDASRYTSAIEVALADLARHPRVVAIGETGLDYHYDHSPRAVQQEVFRAMIRLARTCRKPLIVHTREARSDTLAILEEEEASSVGGVIHCFSEDWSFAERALVLGFDISFSGMLTFKAADVLRDVAARLPADRILVETDSPYLSPVPVRGRPCEPAYVVHTARRLAEVRHVPLDVLAAQTSANAVRRFRLVLEHNAGSEAG